MQLILTPPPKVMVILKEISFNCGSPVQHGRPSVSILAAKDRNLGYIVMLRARMFRSLIPVLMIKERNIRARNITI